MAMCKDSVITSEAYIGHDTHKKTQVSQQQGQLNVGLLHNAAVNSDYWSDLLQLWGVKTSVKIGIYWVDWQEESEDGSSVLIDN